MNLKNFRRIADKFDQKNSSEKTRKDPFLTSEDDKLEFFWENSRLEEKEDVDISSIIGKTQDKIRNEKLKHQKKIFLFTTSVAAAVLLCVSVMYFLSHSGSSATDFKKMARAFDGKAIEEVTLITPEEEHQIEKGAIITYSKDGDVLVNSHEIGEVKEPGDKIGEEEYNILFVPSGKRARIVLSDGTALTVNSLSKVIYPRRFQGSVRKIYTQGEVYAEVVHDKNCPFIVETDDFNLKVLGTTFAVSNYQALGTSTVVLVEGAVEVTDLKDNKATLSPNDLLCVTSGSIESQRQVNVEEYISWLDGVLLLNGRNLSTVIKKLNIHYGSSIQCTPDIGKKKIYGKLDLKGNVEDVLESIQQTVPLKIEKIANDIYLK